MKQYQGNLARKEDPLGFSMYRITEMKLKINSNFIKIV